MCVRLKALIAVLLAVGVLASTYVLYWNRYVLERDFKNVELMMDYSDIVNISSLTGKSVREVLEVLKESGLTTVLFKEMTINDVERYEPVVVYSKNELMLKISTYELPNEEDWKNILVQQGLEEYMHKRNNHIFRHAYPHKDCTYFICYDKETFKRLHAQLEAKVPRTSYFFVGDLYVISVPVSKPMLRQIGLGFPKRHIVSNVEHIGLSTMVQVRSWPNADKKSIYSVFADIKKIKSLSGILFNDHIIVGTNEKLLTDVAAAIEKINDEREVPIVVIEFFSQKGFNELAYLLNNNVVRLHTISPNEMHRYTPNAALERYELAAVERNHRVLLIRPFSAYLVQDVLEFNSEFLKSLKQKLENSGLAIGKASTLPNVSNNIYIAFLIGISTIAGAALLCFKLCNKHLLNKFLKNKFLALFCGVFVIFLWVFMLFLIPREACKLMALISAIVFPTLAVILFVDSNKSSIYKSILKLLLITLCSLMGALFMAGLLVGTDFMLKLDQFRGVKVAHLMPLIIVLLVFAYRGTRGKNLYEKLCNLWYKPLVLGVCVVGAFVFVALAVYLIRTGNEGMAISQLELQMRSTLDAVFGVRPRTKEFLLGHPAIILLLYYGYKHNWYLPLVMLGTIGQISLVNTFAHLHTPLVVSFERTLNGLILGVVIGVLAILICGFIKRVYKRFAFVK
ncbi:DUF5693 family protein [Peptococcaceae bacterium]|nr:DUF5693 family protein [Peptococcaceae bacterium]